MRRRSIHRRPSLGLHPCLHAIAQAAGSPYCDWKSRRPNTLTAELWDCLTTCKPKTVSRKRGAGAVPSVNRTGSALAHGHDSDLSHDSERFTTRQRSAATRGEREPQPPIGEIRAMDAAVAAS